MTIQAVTPIVIEAPLDGQIVDLVVTDGLRVDAGTRVARVVDASVLWVDAKLFPAQLARASGAKVARISIQGAAHPIQARVLDIATPINEETRVAKLYLEMIDPPADLRIGSLATAVFAVADGTAGWRVPESALLRQSGELVVYVQTGPETFMARAVSVAPSPEPGEVVVTAGLEDGARVVVQGNYQLLMSAR